MKQNYTPTYFLASLGLGGMAVSFFVYLTFMVEHKGLPMVTFDNILPVFQGDSSILTQALVAFAMLCVLVLGVLHFKMLIWNIKQYKLFKTTEAFGQLKSSQAEVSLMVMPLTFTMSINVGFVFGALFVPGLWGVVEFLFPFALLGFAVCGYYALKIFGDYIARVIKDGGFNHEANNNLSQMIAIFAFGMVGVGFAAPGAMSHYITINAIGLFFAIMFSAIAIFVGFIKLVMGAKYMLSKGIAIETAPTIWILVPILTLLGITFIRISVGLDHHFGSVPSKGGMFALTSVFMALEILIGILGYKVLVSLGYFEQYVYGDKKSAISYALICPGVAFFVFGMFFLHFGLVQSGVVEKYGIAYFALMLPLVYVQYITLKVLLVLNKKHFPKEA